MTDHTALISSLEKATEGSRELDWRVAEALGDEAFAVTSLTWPPFAAGSRIDKAIPRYTTSLDAIVALIERKFPGHLPGFIALASDRSHTASTFALGLCARLLRALQHQGGGNHG